MNTKIENLHSAAAHIKERGGAYGASSSKMRQIAATKSAALKKTRAHESSAAGGAKAGAGHTADSVNISQNAEKFIQMFKSAAGEATSAEAKVGKKESAQGWGTQELSKRGAALQQVFSFIRSVMEKQANTDDVQSKAKNSTEDNAFVSRLKPKHRFGAAEIGKPSEPNAAFAGEQAMKPVSPVKESKAGGVVKPQVEEDSKEIGTKEQPSLAETGFEKSSPQSSTSAQVPNLDGTEEMVGSSGENEGEAAAAMRLWTDQISDNAEKITTPFENAAEVLKKNSPLNTPADTLSGTKDKLKEGADKVEDKAEEAAGKAKEAADKTAKEDQDEKKGKVEDKEDNKGDNEKEISSALRRRIIEKRKMEREEIHSENSASKKVGDDEAEKTNAGRYRKHAESTGRAEQSEPTGHYRKEIFGPYFTGLSDRIDGFGFLAATADTAAERQFVGLKGVVHLNDELIGSPAVTGNEVVLHIGEHSGPVSVGNFSFRGFKVNSSAQSLFETRKGISAYRALERTVG
ncbi:MAG: hypothetical protein C4576_23460 [Desulfobacteraceae bacterium]|nr:MAG: hypothetical protein C4576_23460 [Desulfobacteraceae bacterium]